MLQFIMMAGAPCSGKSTCAKKLVEDKGFVLIDSDSYIEEMAKELGISYAAAFRDHISDAMDDLKWKLEEAILDERDIVWDQTNLTKHSRARKLVQIPHQYHKKIIYFDVPAEELLERNETRKEETGKNIPAKVILTAVDTFRVPTIDEGWDVIEKGN